MLATITGATFVRRIEELVYGNFQQGDELIECVEAGMLAPVFNIHDGTRSAVYKLCKILLCPAFRLSFTLDLLA